MAKCPKCNGNGKTHDGWTCDLCHGEKKISDEKSQEWRRERSEKYLKTLPFREGDRATLTIDGTIIDITDHGTFREPDLLAVFKLLSGVRVMVPFENLSNSDNKHKEKEIERICECHKAILNIDRFIQDYPNEKGLQVLKHRYKTKIAYHRDRLQEISPNKKGSEEENNNG